MAAVLLAAALTIPCWNLGAKAAFSDVPSNAWYAQDVAAAEKYGILQGTGNGRFSPDGNLTLAQAITMAARTYAYERGETTAAPPGTAISCNMPATKASAPSVSSALPMTTSAIA